MTMRVLLAFAATASVATLSVSAQNSRSRFVEAWGLTVVENWSGLAHSDAIGEVFELRSSDDKVVARSPSIIGPLLLSRPNREILSCEINSTLDIKAALLFDLNASIIARMPHRTYLRNCGLSDDGRIYWLHYTRVQADKPYNLVVIVGAGGRILSTQRLDHAGNATLTSGTRTYVFPNPEPDWPG